MLCVLIFDVLKYSFELKTFDFLKFYNFTNVYNYHQIAFKSKTNNINTILQSYKFEKFDDHNFHNNKN